MTTTQQTRFDNLLRWTITILVAVSSFYMQKFINSVDKLNETVTIIATEGKQNKSDISLLQSEVKNHESRITIIETNHTTKQ